MNIIIIKSNQTNHNQINNMFKFIALALFVATADASKLYTKQRIQRQMKPKSNILAQLMQPSAADIMEMFDHNGDGKISKEEFNNTLEALANEHNYTPSAEEIAGANAEFDKADTSGDGNVDAAELEAALQGM